MKAYANKHYESHDARWAAKRAAEAQQIADEPRFREMLYLKGKGAVFYTKEDYMTALKAGWTDGVDGNSPAVEKMLKPKRKKKE